MHASTLVLAFAAAAYAQSTTDTAGAGGATDAPSACLLQCVTTAASDAGCASFTDFGCVCTSTAFQDSALQCLQSTCTADDVATAQALQQQQCAGISASGSASDSATGSATGTAISGSVSATGTSTVVSVSTSTATTPPSSSSRASVASSASSVASSLSSRASSAASAASSAASAASSSAASGARKEFGMGGVWAGMVALVGGAVGALVL